MARFLKPDEVVTTRSGHRLTAADLERLADEAEAGYDLSTWKPWPGRPRLDPAATDHSPRIAVRVPGRLHRRVTSKAAREGRSVSQVVRGLLEDYVAAAEDR
jgi:predicted HicB family RNase H-like nuclease